MLTPMVLMMGMTLGADGDATSIDLLKQFRNEFVLITPGSGKFPKSFVMGADDGPKAERPAHPVTFEYSFSIAKFEVPQNLWEAVMKKNPSRWKGPRNSVEMLSYDEAVEFCQTASAMMREAKLIDRDQEIRLPSEAEWEYVARAGTKTAYSFGDGIESIDDYAWYTGNAAGNDPAVGELKPNPWGLYDIHGYLWEWCADAASDNYQDAPRDGSPREVKGATRRVIRGGSWKDKADSLKSRARTGEFRHAGGKLNVNGGIPAATRDDAVGLRCVLAKSH